VCSAVCPVLSGGGLRCGLRLSDLPLGIIAFQCDSVCWMSLRGIRKMKHVFVHACYPDTVRMTTGHDEKINTNFHKQLVTKPQHSRGRVPSISELSHFFSRQIYYKYNRSLWSCVGVGSHDPSLPATPLARHFIIAFRVSRRRREMYIGHARLCVCLTVPRRMPTLCTEADVRNGRRFPLVVRYWADLQSVHGFRCYDNTARTRNVSECLYSFYARLSLSRACRCMI